MTEERVPGYDSLSFWEKAQYGWWMTMYEVTGNTDYLSHAQALVAVDSQATAEDTAIYETVESEKIVHTGILGVLDDTGDAIGTFWKNFLNVFKNLPVIVIAVAVVILFIFLYPYLRKGNQ